MGLFVIAAALTTLIGISGVILNLAVPAWRPQGVRRNRATIRVAAFATLAILAAIALVILLQTSSGTVHYG